MRPLYMSCLRHNRKPGSSVGFFTNIWKRLTFLLTFDLLFITPMNCLFVDDDIDDQEIFAFALQELDKSVSLVTAGNGIEALEMLKADKTFIPDCIFLDLNMPRMNGKECLPEIRKLAWLKDVPIFIYTTSSEEKDRLDAKMLGATDFMVKESSLDRLKRSLNDLFHRHKI